MINLFLNEKIIDQVPNLFLTNFRVVMEISKANTFYKHSILLKNIQSVQIIEQRKQKWLWQFFKLTLYAIIIYLIGHYFNTNIQLLSELLKNSNSISTLVFIIAIGYLVFYLFFKKKGLLISSANSEIFFAYEGFRHNMVDFVDNIEVAMINFTIGTVVIKK